MKLTLRGIAQRAIWELDGRSGFKALRTPPGLVPTPAYVPEFAVWYAALPADHRLRSVPHPEGDPVVAMPVDWHYDPPTGGRWPDDRHWTQAMAANVGDLRSTWEVNRFGHVWDWIADDRDGAAEFERQVLDWRAANPFRAGVNWASGQEIALRSLAWLAGGAAWGSRMTALGWQSLVELLYWHGVQLEAEFAFAVGTVRNNHVLSEALGLAAIGDAFAGLPEAAHWRAAGLKAFGDAVREQFFDDGGYCQHSHAYHAFALELLFEASDWFAELRDITRPVFERSLTYFSAIVEPGGRAPNYGPNDRFRPVDYGALLAELARRCGREPEPAGSVSFACAGLHVLRDGGATATLRCGRLAHRAGHDDGLHLEVWLGGEPVAVDAGSFQYRSVEHDYYMNARSHNVVVVGRRGPRQLVTRFTWNDAPDPVLEEFDPRRGLVSGSYDIRNMRWERRVRLSGGVVDVVDQVNAMGGDDRLRTLSLGWLLDAAPDDVRIEQQESFTWNILSPRARITVSMEPLLGSLNLTQAGVWPASISPVYGVQEMVSRIELETAARAVRFRTRFEPR